MTIEKTFKLTIKDAAYFLTEQEVTALYEQCRQALNISATNPNCHGVTGTGISTANVPSSKGINFISDDMETIKDNNKWRSSVQKALDKLSAKTNVTTSDGTTIR